MSEPIPLSLYIHIPWCVRKCPYCDFNSHALREPVDQAAYVDALLRDLDQEVARQVLPEIGSIFIGGGTPSLFDGAMIERLLSGVAARVALADDIEITLEANPGTVEAAHFSDYRRAGVNRLSLGVQSLDDARLADLGRIHSAQEARAALRLARDAGFDNVNLDLMYGLPSQTLDQARRDLLALIELGPEHISWYQLTLEPNTQFHHAPPPLPDDDRLADMMEVGQQILAGAGFAQYEISAYAQPGRQCRHNLNYWQFGDYLGIGAGAHGKLTLADGRVWRRCKPRQPAAYLRAIQAGNAPAGNAVVAEDLPVEFMLNVLRLNDGVPVETLRRRTGLEPERLASALAAVRERGLLAMDPDVFRPTAQGRRFLNDLLALFEPD